MQAFKQGDFFTTELEAGFMASPSGHISFTLPKMEFYPELTMPTYYLKVCSSGQAGADIWRCDADSCVTPMRRE